MYIYIYVSVMRRESGCSLDDGDYGSVKLTFFFQGNVTILISKFVALSVIDRFLMPFLKYFILFHPIFDEPCAEITISVCDREGK